MLKQRVLVIKKKDDYYRVKAHTRSFIIFRINYYSWIIYKILLYIVCRKKIVSELSRGRLFVTELRSCKKKYLVPDTQNCGRQIFWGKNYIEEEWVSTICYVAKRKFFCDRKTIKNEQSRGFNTIFLRITKTINMCSGLKSSQFHPQSFIFHRLDQWWHLVENRSSSIRIITMNYPLWCPKDDNW